MKKKTISVPVDPEPVYLVRGSLDRFYRTFPSYLVVKFKFEVIRERYSFYRSKSSDNASGHRAQLTRVVKMSDESLRKLRKLYEEECVFSDLPF